MVPFAFIVFFGRDALPDDAEPPEPEPAPAQPLVLAGP
jgi:hypothetical protein